MVGVKATAEELVNLTAKEVNELATVLKDEYGIELAAAAVAVAGLATIAIGGATEEKSDSDVVPVGAGANRLKVVKAVKEVCDPGLKEVKDLVDGAPSTLKEGIVKAEAKNLKATIEAEGAKVELK